MGEANKAGRQYSWTVMPRVRLPEPGPWKSQIIPAFDMPQIGVWPEIRFHAHD